MSRPIYPREEVARQFAIAPRVLLRLERRGLVRVVREGDVEGYGPTEIRRLWTILSCRRDLGINLAGVEAILKLNEQMDRLHRRLEALAAEMQAALEPDGAGTDG